MKTITVEVRDDHLESLARTKPMTALAELVWNALDAEATEVRVAFADNEIGGTDCIRVSDNGHGLSYDDAMLSFRNLGGSWKRVNPRTADRNRVMHGKYGKGRFRAFSLGNVSSWRSAYLDGAGVRVFSLSGNAARIGEFAVTDPAPAPDPATGMTVEIREVTDAAGLLRGVKAVEEFTNIFAPYLRQYPDTRIFFDGVPVDPASVEERATVIDLGEMVSENGDRMRAELLVVEWSKPGRRGVFLCDEDGFMRLNALPRLHFRGFSYSAYVKSAHVAVLDRQGMLEAGELCADVRQLLDAARARLREHFALREAEDAQDLLAFWKRTALYPYAGAPKDAAEEAERKVFDIYATHLNRIFADFAESSSKNKRLVLRMMQELARRDAVSVALILDELLHFPEETLEEIQELAGQD